MAFQINGISALKAATINHGGTVVSPRKLLVPENKAITRPVALFHTETGKALFRVNLSVTNRRAAPQTIVASFPDGTEWCGGSVHPDSERSDLFHSELDLRTRWPELSMRLPRITWSLRDRNGSTVRQELKMEVYLLARSVDFSRTPRGIPLEWLRLILRKPGVTTVASIVQKVFDQSPPRYNAWEGRSYFTFGTKGTWLNTIVFSNNRYQKAKEDPNAIHGCYDAAAYLQVLLELAGHDVKYGYLKPFGYIKKTNLKGRGQCNNPFYAGPSPILGDRDVAPFPMVLPEIDKRRWPFLDHAFCIIRQSDRQRAADACAGPHIGNEDLSQYLKNSIGKVVPEKPIIAARGEVQPCDGVVRIDTASIPRGNMSVSDPTTDPWDGDLAAFKQIVGYDEAVIAASPHKARSVRWPVPTTCSILADWSILSDDIAAGYPLTNRRWVLRKEDATVYINIDVSSDGPSAAHQHFFYLGAVHQKPSPAGRVGPANLGQCSYTFTGQGHRVYASVVDNLTIEVSATKTQVDLHGVLKWLIARAEHTSEDGASLQPRILPVSPTQASVGTILNVNIDCEPSTQIAFSVSNGGLMLVEDQEKRLGFLARQSFPFGTAIDLVGYNPDTLLSSHERVEIEIIEEIAK